MSDQSPPLLRLDRLERACLELAQAIANFTGALQAEFRRLESTVAPHSHPAEVSASPVTDQPVAPVSHDAPVGDFLDVSSQTSGSHGNKSRGDPAPAEPKAPPAAFLSASRWTPERLELLRETYTSGVPLGDIELRLNALPSKIAVSKNQIGAMAATKGWQRPPESRLKPPDSWTPERLAVAQPLYETGAPMAQIIAAVNALPGPPINPYRVTVFAGAHRWTRGGPAEQSVSTTPVPANATEIIHWAGQRGIMVGRGTLPIDKINAKRADLGMPPFALTPSLRGAIA
jgi:hypothetical protein